VSRSSRRKRGRPYQPLPARRPNRWIVQLVVVAVGVILLFGSCALLGGVT
jgi:hypothetical protein